jgi:hypothetical protein
MEILGQLFLRVHWAPQLALSVMKCFCHLSQLAGTVWEDQPVRSPGALRLHPAHGLNLSVFLAKLQHFEATNPGSVEVRSGTGKKTVIIVGKGHLNTLGLGIAAGLA